jgi:hypothetical protein
LPIGIEDAKAFISSVSLPSAGVWPQIDLVHPDAMQLVGLKTAPDTARNGLSTGCWQGVRLSWSDLDRHHQLQDGGHARDGGRNCHSGRHDQSPSLINVALSSFSGRFHDNKATLIKGFAAHALPGPRRHTDDLELGGGGSR